MISKDIYADVRQQSLGWTVVLIGAGTWIVLLLADMSFARLPSEWIGGAVITIAICAALYMLRTDHLRLACYAAATCRWAGNAFIAFLVPQP